MVAAVNKISQRAAEFAAELADAEAHLKAVKHEVEVWRGIKAELQHEVANLQQLRQEKVAILKLKADCKKFAEALEAQGVK